MSGGRRLRWVALALVPSSLMLGATTYITTDIAAIPLLWVLPLGLYLLSFILVFSRLPDVVHRLMVLLLPPLLLTLLVTMLGLWQPGGLGATIGLHLVTLFVVSMVCHGELARDRPSTHYLTGYYLWISVGGVLGGLFNSLLAPVLFTSLAEYPLVMVLACLLLPRESSFLRAPRLVLDAVGAASLAAIFLGKTLLLPHLDQMPFRTGWLAGTSALWEAVALVLLLGLGLAHVLRTATERRSAWLDFLLPLAVGALTLYLAWGVDAERTSSREVLVIFGVPALLCWTFLGRPLRFGLGVAFLTLGAGIAATAVDDALYRKRSFFGVVTVGENSRALKKPLTYQAPLASTAHPATITLEKGEPLDYRWLFHGSTLHGRQFQRQDLHDVPLTYYHLGSPVGQLLRAANTGPHRRLGVIGLGTGTLACYALPGQQLIFYDIDPLIRDIAYEPDTALFTFVADARKRGARVDLIMGDARVRMTQQQMDEPERYGILVIDAFSSDAIPVHLITREALQVYLSHLREDGILAFHITNQHLDLEPVLANLADDLGLAALFQYGGYDKRLSTLSSKWMLLARKPEHLRCVSGSAEWKPPRTAPRVGVWTDDYSNVLSVFRR